MTTAHNRRPIGYWVKLLDQRIEGSFGVAFAAEGLLRRHWQALNVLQNGPLTMAQVDQELAPFLDDASPFLRDLQERGWIAEARGAYSLTPLGQASLDRLLRTIRVNRARITDGLTEEQYVNTVDALERMCANLAWADGA